ncbi:E3 ubiquitin-protein ligase synoviolin [Symbiodinium microadriaticum]|uniref:RING-type E3 ubiquitin transferase n=1 Tax=Symbiodinium microadriaticum TaxID=2951 RepID=A0A1Q9C9B7_SYMMI|nr:E3 ubiquitin-protein ligase synoviolin [Symbiodinium microadriaticum]
MVLLAMNFSSYIVLSTLVVAGVVAHAFVVHEQFYPAVIYLSTDKMCLAVMYNFAFALFLLLGKIILRVFIGTLRDVEVEQLVDSGRGFLADTILFLVFYAPTIDNREVGTVFLIQYICCVIFMKVGVPRLIVNIKLVGLMALLLGCDLLALSYFYSVASKSSTFFTWILFEALTMSSVVLVSMCKYSIHMIDLRISYLQVARKLAQRLRSFRRYRRISMNMELCFPDATDAEIEENEFCVICRDSLFEGSKPKKLSCGHIFHIDCLKSWLVMQQVCPTCSPKRILHYVDPFDGGDPSRELFAQRRYVSQAAENCDPEPPLAEPEGNAEEWIDPGEPEEAEETGLAAAQAAAAAAQAQIAAPRRPPAPAQPGSASSAAAPENAGLSVLGLAASSSHEPAPSEFEDLFEPPVEDKAEAREIVDDEAPIFERPAMALPAVSTGAASSHANGQGFAASEPVQATAAATAYPLAASRQAAPSSAPSSLPPLEEITNALDRAEEMAKFLREQQDFWMEQVRQIQAGRCHGQATPGSENGRLGKSSGSESDPRRRAEILRTSDLFVELRGKASWHGAAALMSNIVIDFEVLPEDGPADRSAPQVCNELLRQLQDPSSELRRGEFGRYAANASISIDGGPLTGAESPGEIPPLVPTTSLAEPPPVGPGGGKPGVTLVTVTGQYHSRPLSGLDPTGREGLSNAELLERIAQLERQITRSAVGGPGTSFGGPQVVNYMERLQQVRDEMSQGYTKLSSSVSWEEDLPPPSLPNTGRGLVDFEVVNYMERLQQVRDEMSQGYTKLSSSVSWEEDLPPPSLPNTGRGLVDFEAAEQELRTEQEAGRGNKLKVEQMEQKLKALEEGERKGPPPAEYPHPLVEEAEEERRQKVIKSPTAYTLANLASAFWLLQKGRENEKPSFQSCNHLDYFRKERGRTTKPRVFDDGNFNLESPASVKAVTEVTGFDRKAMELGMQCCSAPLAVPPLKLTGTSVEPYEALVAQGVTLMDREQLLSHAKEMWMKENVRASKLADALTAAEDKLADQERRLADVTAKYTEAQQEVRQLQHLLGSSTSGLTGAVPGDMSSSGFLDIPPSDGRNGYAKERVPGSHLTQVNRSSHFLGKQKVAASSESLRCGGLDLPENLG